MDYNDSKFNLPKEDAEKVTKASESIFGTAGHQYIERGTSDPFYGMDLGTKAVITSTHPTEPKQTFKGKTIGMWSIERRRIANQLYDKWKLALQNIEEPSFAMYIDDFCSQIRLCMPDFREVPNEDAFCGILQIILEAIEGEKFNQLFEDENLRSFIEATLANLIKLEKIKLSDFNDVTKQIIKIQFSS